MQWTALIFGSVLLLASAAQATDLYFLRCAQVAFLRPGCVAAVDPPKAPPQRTMPLFPRETTAPDTPELLREIMEHPSDELIDVYLDWQQARQERLQQVTDRIKQRLQQRTKGTK